MTSKEENGPKEISPIGLSSYKALVVDDHEELLGVVKDVLTDSGFFVSIANDAKEGLDSLQNQAFDIIICDITMPGMDGFSFQNIVQQNPDWCHIPFIFLSALSSSSEIRQGRELGCDDYLTKPFDPLDLVAVVRGKLTLAKRREQVSKQRIETYRRRIIQTLSHEFRTPLVAINTGTELLIDQHDKLPPERVNQLLQSIQRGGIRLQRLVDDFMTLRQIDSGSAENTCQRLRRKQSLKQLVQGTVELFQSSFEDSSSANIIYERNESSPLWINVYDIQIVDILQRLLSNADKFNQTDKPVVVSLTNEKGFAKVSIRDFGPGLSKELWEPAQEMFNQINREKFEQQGSGVGLTIASYFTEINGGLMNFKQPADGQGGLIVEVAFPIFIAE